MYKEWTKEKKYEGEMKKKKEKMNQKKFKKKYYR